MSARPALNTSPETSRTPVHNVAEKLGMYPSPQVVTRGLRLLFVSLDRLLRPRLQVRPHPFAGCTYGAYLDFGFHAGSVGFCDGLCFGALRFGNLRLFFVVFLA